MTFADGTGGVFDFAPYLEHPCYEPLRDRAFFEKVQAAHGTSHGRARSTYPPKPYGRTRCGRNAVSIPLKLQDAPST